MSSRLSRRTLLAGVAALPALAVLGCESDRTTADPISTVNTLDFANRLRIPELADSTVDGDGVRVFRLGRDRWIGRVPQWRGNADLGIHGRSLRRRISRSDLAGSPQGAGTRSRREPVV
jgi:hypothetical protein